MGRDDLAAHVRKQEVRLIPAWIIRSLITLQTSMSLVNTFPELLAAHGANDARSLLQGELVEHRDLLLKLAGKYIWWFSAEESMDFPQRIIAQVMNIGVLSDVCLLVDSLGEDRLIVVLQPAEAGQFSARSWHYWHYLLGLARAGNVPPLPIRYIPEAL